MTPTEIADKLTPAQRKALLWLPYSIHEGKDYNISHSGAAIFEIEKMRLCRLVQHDRWFLLPLGYDVRAVLEARGDG